MTAKQFHDMLDRSGPVWAVRALAISMMATWPLDWIEGMLGTSAAAHPAVRALNVACLAAVIGAMFLMRKPNHKVLKTSVSSS